MTGASIAFTPELMSNDLPVMTVFGTVSALGIRLSALSNENGQISRTATAAHSAQGSHFGAFASSRRRTTTARMSQPAAMLMFSILRNTASTFYSFPAAASIIRLISAASFGDRDFLRVNAAMNAGSEPSKASSTNCSLRAA